jgi:uncharacterized protein
MKEQGIATGGMDDNVGISVADCWRILGCEEVGRLVVATYGFPSIFPVNFSATGEAIYFLTGAGSKLHAMEMNSSVSFQVDSWDGDAGWSICVKGIAEVLDGETKESVLARARLNPWVQGEHPHLVRVTAQHVAGRRFTFARPAKRYGQMRPR